MGFSRERKESSVSFCANDQLRLCAPTPVFLWCCFAHHSRQHDMSALRLLISPLLGRTRVNAVALLCLSLSLACGRQVDWSGLFVLECLIAYVFISAAFSSSLCPCVLRSLPCTSCNWLVPAGMSKKSSNPVVSLTSGCIAGAVEAICVWPLEFVKASSSNFRHVFLL